MNNYYYVNGYENAKSFQAPLNQNVLLIDTDNPYIYMKSTNGFGQSSIQCFKIESCPCPSDNKLTRDDLKEILERLKSLEEKQNEPTMQQ